MADCEMLNFHSNNRLWIKFKAQDFTSEVSNKHAFKIWRKKWKEFFDHRSNLTNSKTLCSKLHYKKIKHATWDTMATKTASLLWTKWRKENTEWDKTTKDGKYQIELNINCPKKNTMAWNISLKWNNKQYMKHPWSPEHEIHIANETYPGHPQMYCFPFICYFVLTYTVNLTDYRKRS